MSRRKRALTEESFKGQLEGTDFMSPSCGGTVRINGGRVVLNGYEDVTDTCDWSKLMDEFYAWNMGGAYQKMSANKKTAGESLSTDANGQLIEVGDTVKPTAQYDSNEYAGATGKVTSVEGYGTQVKVKWNNGQNGWVVCNTLEKVGSKRVAGIRPGDRVKVVSEGKEGTVSRMDEMSPDHAAVIMFDGDPQEYSWALDELEKVGSKKSSGREVMAHTDPLTGKSYECFLEDDGTMDTVISVNGFNVRFNSEEVERADNGSIPQEELNRLFDEAIESYEENGPGLDQAVASKKSAASDYPFEAIAPSVMNSHDQGRKVWIEENSGSGLSNGELTDMYNHQLEDIEAGGGVTATPSRVLESLHSSRGEMGYKAPDKIMASKRVAADENDLKFSAVASPDPENEGMFFVDVKCTGPDGTVGEWSQWDNEADAKSRAGQINQNPTFEYMQQYSGSPEADMMHEAWQDFKAKGGQLTEATASKRVAGTPGDPEGKGFVNMDDTTCDMCGVRSGDYHNPQFPGFTHVNGGAWCGKCWDQIGAMGITPYARVPQEASARAAKLGDYIQGKTYTLAGKEIVVTGMLIRQEFEDVFSIRTASGEVYPIVVSESTLMKKRYASANDEVADLQRKREILEQESAGAENEDQERSYVTRIEEIEREIESMEAKTAMTDPSFFGHGVRSAENSIDDGNLFTLESPSTGEVAEDSEEALALRPKGEPGEGSEFSAVLSSRKTAGYGARNGNKSEIQDIYDSLNLDSTNDESFRKPPFVKINGEVSIGDNGSVVVFTGSYMGHPFGPNDYINAEGAGMWYELSGVPSSKFNRQGSRRERRRANSSRLAEGNSFSLVVKGTRQEAEQAIQAHGIQGAEFQNDAFNGVEQVFKIEANPELVNTLNNWFIESVGGDELQAPAGTLLLWSDLSRNASVRTALKVGDRVEFEGQYGIVKDMGRQSRGEEDSTPGQITVETESGFGDIVFWPKSEVRKASLRQADDSSFSPGDVLRSKKSGRECRVVSVSWNDQYKQNDIKVDFDGTTVIFNPEEASEGFEKVGSRRVADAAPPTMGGAPEGLEEEPKTAEAELDPNIFESKEENSPKAFKGDEKSQSKIDEAAGGAKGYQSSGPFVNPASPLGAYAERRAKKDTRGQAFHDEVQAATYGYQIPMMQIGDVYRAAEQAFDNGQNVTDAVHALLDQIAIKTGSRRTASYSVGDKVLLHDTFQMDGPGIVTRTFPNNPEIYEVMGEGETVPDRVSEDMMEKMPDEYQERLNINASCPPDVPKKVKDKVKDEYGKDDPRTYKTLWTIEDKMKDKS